MKVLRNIVAAVLIASTIFTFAACNGASKKDKLSTTIQKISKDYAGYLQDKFGIPEDKVRKMDPNDPLNSHPYNGEYYICIDRNMPAMECFVYDNADEAREYFVTRYDIFNERFDEEHFQGNCQAELKDNSGYIVINGTDSGVGIFGDQYAHSGIMLYAGIYYSGNTVLVIMPRNEISVDRVQEIISIMGLPMADGTNT